MKGEAPSIETKVMEISKDHGLRMVKQGVSYYGESLENLPDDIRRYWERKKEPGITQEQLREIGESIVQKYGDA